MLVARNNLLPLLRLHRRQDRLRLGALYHVRPDRRFGVVIQAVIKRADGLLSTHSTREPIGRWLCESLHRLARSIGVQQCRVPARTD